MRILITFSMLFLTIGMNAQQSISGIWNIGQDNTKIEITETDDIYEAKIISSGNSKVKIGSQFLKDVKSVGREWKGKLYNLKKGKWYDVIIVGKGSKMLATVKAGFMSKTLEWNKE